MSKDELKKCHKAVVVNMYCNYLMGVSTRLTRLLTPSRYRGLWTLETSLSPIKEVASIWDWCHVMVLVSDGVVEKLVENCLVREDHSETGQNVVLTAEGCVCAKAWLAEGFGGRVHRR